MGFRLRIVKPTRQGWYLSFLFLGSAILFTWPILITGQNAGIRDWDMFTAVAAIPVDTISRYGEFPFWNPYMAGGNILFHHPEFAVLSPVIILYALLGPVFGLKIQLFLTYLFGLAGSYYLARQERISVSGSILVAFAYFGSVHFSLHFAEGHTSFTHFAFLPWIGGLMSRSLERPLTIVPAAVCFALLILGNGAAVPLLYTAIFLVLYALSLAIRERAFLPMRNCTAVLVLGAGLSAVKLLPMVFFFMEHPWPGSPDESLPLSYLWSIFFGLNQQLSSGVIPGLAWGWHEYGAYISPVLVVLAICALAYKLRHVWPWLGIGLFFFLLGLGDFGALSPWAILSNLPGFGSARCTARSFQFVILAVSVVGALGMDTIREEARARISPLLLSSLQIFAIIVVAGTNLYLALGNYANVFPGDPPTVTRDPIFRHEVNRSRGAFESVLANRGALVVGQLPPNLPSRAIVAENDSVMMEHILSGSATVTRRENTPNRIAYELSARSAGELAISMGYDPGWTADDGRAVTEMHGVLRVPFAAGEERFTLVYRPPGLRIGILISLLSIVAVTCLCFRPRPLLH